MIVPRHEEFKPVDWWRVDQCILERCPGIKPREIDDLTLSEISLILADPREPRPYGGLPTPMDTADDVGAAWDLWRAMSPREKLQWYMTQGY